jgi:ubiquinone/menaquinone biosynthesis C-methylase UbiE
MTTDYNQISTQYKEAKEHPWRHYVESYSLMKLVGDTTGLRVIDVACGEGHFTRKLQSLGAAKTVGIDISEKMVELARAQEAADPLGIKYFVEDARVEGPQQDFDLAASAWLLVYAHNREELAQMCRSLARRLRPGGRFVTLTTNPDVYFFPEPTYRKYGFDILVENQPYEGAPIDWVIYLKESTFGIQNYFLPIDAYEAAFLEAGFRDVRFHRLSLSSEGELADGREHWEHLLRYPPAILIDCIRQ